VQGRAALGRFGSPLPHPPSAVPRSACPAVPGRSGYPVRRKRGRWPRRRRGRLRYPPREGVARPSPAAAQAPACGCTGGVDCSTATHPAVFASVAPRRGRKSLAQGFIPGYPGKQEDISAVGTAAQAGRGTVLGRADRTFPLRVKTGAPKPPGAPPPGRMWGNCVSAAASTLHTPTFCDQHNRLSVAPRSVQEWERERSAGAFGYPARVPSSCSWGTDAVRYWLLVIGYSYWPGVEGTGLKLALRLRGCRRLCPRRSGATGAIEWP